MLVAWTFESGSQIGAFANSCGPANNECTGGNIILRSDLIGNSSTTQLYQAPYGCMNTINNYISNVFSSVTAGHNYTLYIDDINAFCSEDKDDTLQIDFCPDLNGSWRSSACEIGSFTIPQADGWTNLETINVQVNNSCVSTTTTTKATTTTTHPTTTTTKATTTTTTTTPASCTYSPSVTLVAGVNSIYFRTPHPYGNSMNCVSGTYTCPKGAILMIDDNYSVASNDWFGYAASNGDSGSWSGSQSSHALRNTYENAVWLTFTSDASGTAWGVDVDYIECYTTTTTTHPTTTSTTTTTTTHPTSTTLYTRLGL